MTAKVEAICAKLEREFQIGVDAVEYRMASESAAYRNPDGLEAATLLREQERRIAELEAALDLPGSWQLSWDEDDDPSECCWQVHSVHGGRNDREWTLLATGETPLEAIATAKRRATLKDSPHAE